MGNSSNKDGIKDWPKFLWACFYWSFTRMERGAGLVSNFIALLPYFLTFGIFTPLGLQETVLQNLSITIAKGSFVILLILIFTIAPYQLYKKEALRANKAEEKLKPRISLQGVVLPMEPDNLVCIRVVNLGTEPIRNCKGSLKSVYAEYDGRWVYQRKMLPMNLYWSERYASQKEGSHTILTEADIDLVKITPDIREGPLPTIIQPGAEYGVEKRPYILEIEVAAENSAPIRRNFKLTFDPLRFEDVSETIELPTSDTEGSQN